MTDAHDIGARYRQTRALHAQEEAMTPDTDALNALAANVALRQAASGVSKVRAARQARDARGRFQRAPSPIPELCTPALVPCAGCSKPVSNRAWQLCDACWSDVRETAQAGDHDSRVWSENAQPRVTLWQRILHTLGWL